MNGTLKPRAVRRVELHLLLYDARQRKSKDFLSFCIYGLSLRQGKEGGPYPIRVCLESSRFLVRECPGEWLAMCLQERVH